MMFKVDLHLITTIKKTAASSIIFYFYFFCFNCSICFCISYRALREYFKDLKYLPFIFWRLDRLLRQATRRRVSTWVELPSV